MKQILPPPPISAEVLAALPAEVSNWLNSLDMYLRETVLMHNEIKNAEAVGGVGSAGAGAQYVAISIGGITYKVLHDGVL